MLCPNETAEKYASESKPFHFDFSEYSVILAGDTIASVTSVTAVVGLGLTIQAAGSWVKSADGKSVSGSISAGTVGTLYKILCTVLTAAGHTLVMPGWLQVL